jgi:hypothetical protein
MKKTKTSNGPATKTTFGKRREGKHSKSFGPKKSKPKRYRGQGR